MICFIQRVGRGSDLLQRVEREGQNRQNQGFGEQLFGTKPSIFQYAASLWKSCRDGVFGPLEPQERCFQRFYTSSMTLAWISMLFPMVLLAFGAEIPMVFPTLP